MENGERSSGIPREYAPRSYALSGKIMLTAVIILFTVVILVVGLHLYARWYLLRARRRQYLRRRAHRTHFVFSGDGQTTSATTTVISPSLGLDASVLKSLPIFVYSPNSHKEVLECAVCLSEFEENEKGRVLPKCKHCFHIDCIDMWLHSHSTCPLCRSPVKPEILPVTIISSDSPVSIDIPVGEFEESEVGSSSGFCSSLINEDEMGSSSSSSSSSRKKPLQVMGVSIEIPKRSESFRGLEEESGSGSPSCQGFKSPVNRIRSLKRLLSRERKTVFSSSSPSSPIPLCCSSNTETDLERGDEQIIQPQQ